jgi:hypothetical protein
MTNFEIITACHTIDFKKTNHNTDNKGKLFVTLFARPTVRSYERAFAPALKTN